MAPAAGRRIAFVSLEDAADPLRSSGAPYNIRKGFLDIGCEVVDVFPLRSTWENVFFPRRAYHRLCGRYYVANREPAYLRDVARRAEAVLARQPVDLVFALHTIPATKLRSSAPIVISHDQTFLERLDYFAYERRPPADAYVAKAYAQEREAFANADLCVFPSHRSAQVLRTRYDVPPERIAAIPWGANLPAEPSRAEALAGLARRGGGRLRLVFVGVDWRRKGGDVVAATCRVLRARGIDVELAVIGTVPPEGVLDPAYMTVHPFLDKSEPSDAAAYAAILAGAHFLFVPSRVEAFGHVFCEAAAYALPSIATDVGGIPTVVEHGTTGHCLPLDAPPAAFADAIEASFRQPARYGAMARAARDRFDEVLNWPAFCRTVLARGLAAGKRAAPPLAG
jgi:glycosyltransferase involved in cell wall biosynthesis